MTYKFSKLVTSTVLASAVFAAAASSAFADDLSREGKVSVRAGVQGIFPTSKKGIKYSSSKNKNTIGGEIAGSYFFADNIATEFAVGYTQYKTTTASSGNFKVRSIPLTATVQFHTPNYGLFSPYIGAGYHYNIMERQSHKNVVSKVKNTHGPVVQLGTNVKLSKEVAVNLDVKQYWFKYKVKFANTQLNLKNKVNPTVVTLGLSYTF